MEPDDDLGDLRHGDLDEPMPHRTHEQEWSFQGAHDGVSAGWTVGGHMGEAFGPDTQNEVAEIGADIGYAVGGAAGWVADHFDPNYGDDPNPYDTPDGGDTGYQHGDGGTPSEDAGEGE
jgi:hypothetical protein